jgi:hypothetical protein
MMCTDIARVGLFRRACRALLLTGCTVGLGCAVAPRPALAEDAPVAKYPEPNPFPTTWELKFKHTAPKRIVVQLANQQFAQAYWYITYTATNLGEKEAPFEPTFDMMANDGKVYPGNSAIAEEVFDTIKRQEGNPLLVSPRKVTGFIQPGINQSKDSVAIWVEPVRQMGTFSIFVGGLSGETVTMKKVGEQYVAVDPKNAAVELKGVKEEDRLLLRKQFMVTYQVLGDERNIGKDPVVKKAEKWVMR